MYNGFWYYKYNTTFRQTCVITLEELLEKYTKSNDITNPDFIKQDIVKFEELPNLNQIYKHFLFCVILILNNNDEIIERFFSSSKTQAGFKPRNKEIEHIIHDTIKEYTNKYNSEIERLSTASVTYPKKLSWLEEETHARIFIVEQLKILNPRNFWGNRIELPLEELDEKISQLRTTLAQKSVPFSISTSGGKKSKNQKIKQKII